MSKTREDVEKLKADWLKDPIWDLYTTEGFEEFEDELKQFEKEVYAEREAESLEKRRKAVFTQMENVFDISTKRQMLKSEIERKQKELQGLAVLEVLQNTYSVKFIGLENGVFAYDVLKIKENHLYRVRFKIFNLQTEFGLRFKHCPCLRFAAENDCQHLLLAVREQAVQQGFSEQIIIEKFADFRLAKTYQKQLLAVA